jgi:hypothetical protein
MRSTGGQGWTPRAGAKLEAQRNAEGEPRRQSMTGIKELRCFWRTRVLIALFGVSVVVSSLAAGPNGWLKITSLPRVGYPGQMVHTESFHVVRSLKEWNDLSLSSVSNGSSTSRGKSLPIDVDFANYTLLLRSSVGG